MEPMELSTIEEGYVYGRTQYILVNHRCSWGEAEFMCQSYPNGSLATIPTHEIAYFVGEILSESDIGPEMLWVGARKVAQDSPFVWITGQDVDQRFMLPRHKANNDTIRNCLAFTRVSHNIPLFVDMECDVKRPFLCSKPYKKSISLGDMTTTDWITIGDYQYGIFYDKIPFSIALRECSKKHYAQLATFRQYEEVRIVAKFMLIGRPSLERAWIGAKYKAGNWTFLGTTSILADRQDEMTKFPPWRYGHSTKRSGCLSLDRHVLTHATFLETRCVKKQSYICSKGRDHLSFVVSIVNNTGYVLYYTPKTWDEALVHCQTHNANLSIVTGENIDGIISLMGENTTEIQHVWIGARLGNDAKHFYWYSNQQQLPNTNHSIKLFPPWYDTEFDRNYACLNMDRESHNLPIFYGANCDSPQPYLCSQTDLSSLPDPNQETTSARPTEDPSSEIDILHVSDKSTTKKIGKA